MIEQICHVGLRKDADSSFGGKVIFAAVTTRTQSKFRQNPSIVGSVIGLIRRTPQSSFFSEDMSSSTAFVGRGGFVLSSKEWANLDLSQLPRETLEALSPRSAEPSPAVVAGKDKAPRGVPRRPEPSIKKRKNNGPTAQDWAMMFK